MDANRSAGIAGYALALVLLATGPAQPAIIGSCTITVLSNGTMTTNPAIDTLSSKNGGGQAAQVRVQPASLVCVVLSLLDCYSISAPPPASFATAPGSGGAGVTFQSSYRLNGGAETNGASAVTVPNGNYLMSLDLTATRSSGVFQSGAYQAQVTVRCE